MLNITRRFHSNLLNQTLRLFLVFELVLNVNNLMSITRKFLREKRLEKIEKQRGENVFVFIVSLFFFAAVVRLFFKAFNAFQALFELKWRNSFYTLNSASEIYNSLALVGSVSTKGLNL